MKVGQRVIAFKWQGKEEIQLTPEMKFAVKQFTKKKGGEIQNWTPETIPQRLEAVDAKFGTKVSASLQLAYLGIYRHASEIAHGTLFGVHFLVGLTMPLPRRLPDDIPSQSREWVSMLMWLLGGCISTLLVVLSNYIEIEPLVEKSRNELNEVGKQIWGEKRKPVVPQTR